MHCLYSCKISPDPQRHKNMLHRHSHTFLRLLKSSRQNKVILLLLQNLGFSLQYLGSYILINSLFWMPLDINESQVVKILAMTVKLKFSNPTVFLCKTTTGVFLITQLFWKFCCQVKQKHQCQVCDLSFNLSFLLFSIYNAGRVECDHINHISG